MYGFYNKILRVNLTQRSYQVEKIEDEVLARYLGGKGLGTHLLMENLKPGVTPLSPDNKLIFVTGPVSGTNLPGGSRYGVFCKSPLTGGYAESYSGGKVAPVMKATGFDAFLLEGASDSPVYLEISDKGVYFHDASHLWGMDTYSTEDKVLAEVNQPGAQAVVIGPAGENLVRFACIENNYWRSAGRTGVGAVMGSKRVKAIVFYGSFQAPIAHPEMLQEYIRDLRERGKTDPGAKSYRTYGTTALVALSNKFKTFPTRYWSQGNFEDWEKINGDYLLNNLDVKSKACPHCFFACGKLSTIKKGQHQGLTVEGPEYETIYAFGGLCAINSMEEILYFNELCDKLGMDTITAGNLVAFTMEAVKRGKLNYDLQYGDAEGVAQLLKMMASREGIGDLLAEGIRKTSQEWGMEDVAIHVKGMEPAGYEPRILKGMSLAYATSPRGACHLRATFYKPEFSGIIDPATTEGKAALFIEYEDRLAIYDTFILCRFFRDMIGWDDLRTIIESITGLKLTKEELQAKGADVVTLTRKFNVREGFGKKDDRIPERYFNEPMGQDSLTREDFKTMLLDFYRLRGWDEEGVPLA